MMTEKTRIPRGSRRRRPICARSIVSQLIGHLSGLESGDGGGGDDEQLEIGQGRRTGKRLLNELIFHATSLFVDQMMIVHRRSSALSVSEAMRDRDDEKKTAKILAARRKTFAITLVCTVD